MNAITNALVAAGVPVPSQRQRIWNWLKDHPQRTSNQVKAALKFEQASSLLAQMERRELVSSVSDYDNATKRYVKWYSAIGASYAEQLETARPLKQEQEQKPTPTPAPKVEPTPAPTPHPTATVDPFNIDNLTIAQARDLYRRLAVMFKGETK